MCASLRVSRNGYTLVELLVAVTILSIALLGIMSAISVAQDTQTRAVRMAIARDIAIMHIENYRSATAGSISTPIAPYSSPDLPSGNVITPTASKYPDSSSTSLWRAVVTVRWPEGVTTRSIAYDTLLYKP
jgi:prepilin-type N-terminal cleavage/methylation domain-containing protein